MEKPLEISWVDTDPSEELEKLIRERADKMERYFDRITSARVTVEVPNRNGAGGKLGYHVGIDVEVPGRRLAVNNDRSFRIDHFTAFLLFSIKPRGEQLPQDPGVGSF